MYSTTYTANYEHIRRAPAKRVFVETSSLVSPIIKKLLLLAVIVNVVLVGVIYIALFMFPQAKYSVTNLTHQEVSVGVETQSFIKELRTGTLKAVPAAIVTRAPLTVQGRAIALNGDNLQVFEYNSAKTAKKEADMLAKKYESTLKESVLSEKNVHIYAKDKLLIFYMGNNKSIIDSIVRNSYQSMEGISLYSDKNQEVSVISKDGIYYK